MHSGPNAVSAPSSRSSRKGGTGGSLTTTSSRVGAFTMLKLVRSAARPLQRRGKSCRLAATRSVLSPLPRGCRANTFALDVTTDEIPRGTMTTASVLLKSRQFFRERERSADGRSEVSAGSRDWEDAYRRRWQHDRVVRSTHGVNCTGSCSWKIHVKDGLVTWETQQTDYPSNGPDVPDYEPRGCPRGASFSWYVYSPRPPEVPVRPRRAARAVPRGAGAARRSGRRLGGDRVGPGQGARLQVGPRQGRLRARRLGRGVGDDRRRPRPHGRRVRTRPRSAGFSPIPAMSMVSYTAGTRFLSADRRRLPELLRLVRRPAAGLAAGLGRPDRRARVRRLVERQLPDDVGLEHPADPHPGRALHDRGALPRPEGRGRLAGLRRPHEVRRPLAARRGRHRRRAGDGDGARDPQRVPRRSAASRTSTATSGSSPTCPSS